MKSIALLLSVVLVQLALGDDLYWVPTSNWNSPSNWKLGRAPCGNDIATFSENSVVFLNDDITIQTIQLPKNGQILLGANVAVTLSEDTANCDDNIDPEPNREVIENEFIGNAPSYWECSGNWITADNFPAKHPPCGNDIAIFEEGSYYFSVRANETIYVRELHVRGSYIDDQIRLDPIEFQLDVKIMPVCGIDPSTCPCPSDTGCPPSPSIESPQPVIAGSIVGVIIAVVVICSLVIVLILALVMYKKKTGRGVFSYNKNELLEYEEQPIETTIHPTPESRNFDNPIYDSTTLTPADLTGSQEKPKLEPASDDQSVNLDVNEYEVVRDLNASKEEFTKVDLGDLGDLGEVDVEPRPVGVGYQPSASLDTEMVEDGNDKKKGKKSGKYERF